MSDHASPTLSALLARQTSRRAMLRGGFSLAAFGLLAACQPARAPIPAARLKHPPAFSWDDVPHGRSAAGQVPAGWRMERLAANLPVTTGLHTVALHPVSERESPLWLSHGMGLSPQDRASTAWTENTTRADATGRAALQTLVTKAQNETGASLQAMACQDGIWRLSNAHPLNRRITMATPIALRGPAAGNGRLQTEADPAGTRVLGMLAAGAVAQTPWGTLLVGEGDIHRHFRFPTDATEAARLPEGRNHVRMSLHDDGWHRWGELDARFDARRTPNEANRFGWVVEIDPANPNSIPVKRTALGRFRHGGIACTSSRDGRIVIYMTDAEVGEYLYRFVSTDAYLPGSKAPADLLDRGVLSVAIFDADGTLRWQPLQLGGALSATEHFTSPADVLIEARRAADLLGATKLDLPAGLALLHGRVYLTLQGDAARHEANPANPRMPNPFGHALELLPPTRQGGFDHASARYEWQFFFQGGNPANPDAQSFYLSRVGAEGWIANPAAISSGAEENLWIATNGMQESSELAEKLYAVKTRGPWRGRPYALFRAPFGSQLSNAAFTPDGNAILISLPQHQEILTLSKENGEKIYR